MTATVQTTANRSVSRPGATARDLALAIGHLDLEMVHEHHLDLLIAVADLADAAGCGWPWGHDDPTVALVRAVAKLALVAPGARSEHAAALVATLESGSGRPAAGDGAD
jgi:hypothetical protein